MQKVFPASLFILFLIRNVLRHFIEVLDFALAFLAKDAHSLKLFGREGIEVAGLELVLVHLIDHKGKGDVHGADLAVDLAHISSASMRWRRK